jgi:uncharacterized protein YndB with AHSA1/START domain
MTEPIEVKSLIVERVMPHPPEKIWRALIDSELIGQWLMRNDFQPIVGHRFRFQATPMAGWKGFTNCEVKQVDAPRRLVYTWGDGTESDSGLKTVVTWTLEAVPSGTKVRMEQSGFRPQDEAGFRGMGSGWPRILEALERETNTLPE